MSMVSITKIDNNTKMALNKSIDLIGGFKHFFNSHDVVLIKPNLNDFENFTSPALTEALIQLLFDNNIKKLFLAESTFGNEKITALHFKKTGYIDLAQKYNLKLFNLNQSIAREVRVKNPLILDKIKIAQEVFQATKIINIPVMKVHYATGVTLSLKNLKGLLSKNEKKHFHEVGLEKAIVDLNNSITANLNIIDCITCMETMGPKGGDLLNLDLIVAGENPGEVDCIGSKIMGFKIEEIKHLQYYIQVNNIDPDKIETAGEELLKIIHPFKRVSMQKIIPPNVNILNINACSACENALLLSFKLLEKKPQTAIDIFLGPKTRQNSSNAIKIGFGNCCKNRGFDKIIRGCPPYPFLLNNVLNS